MSPKIILQSPKIGTKEFNDTDREFYTYFYSKITEYRINISTLRLEEKRKEEDNFFFSLGWYPRTT